MSTAAEAADAAVSAPVDAPAAIQDAPGLGEGQESTGVESAPEGAAKKPQVSEVVRLAREKRALERRVAELTAKPADAKPALTRESIIAELKAKYEEDPESLLEDIAGDDFVKLASRLAKREETAKAPEKQIEALTKELTALKAKLAGDDKAKSEADVSAQVASNIDSTQKAIENATNEDGEPLYPTLVSLDPEALDEPIGRTAYLAVDRAFTKECMKEVDGKLVVVKRWSPTEQQARFDAAFKALEAHYAKLRTPKTPKTPRAQEPDLSPTISNNSSSGHADPPVRRAVGTMTPQEALRQALKEHGLDR